MFSTSSKLTVKKIKSSLMNVTMPWSTIKTTLQLNQIIHFIFNYSTKIKSFSSQLLTKFSNWGTIKICEHAFKCHRVVTLISFCGYLSQLKSLKLTEKFVIISISKNILVERGLTLLVLWQKGEKMIIITFYF